MDFRVSVIMGIYNCEKTLPAALDSLFAQTFTGWKLIMCDDGSADGTYAAAEEYRLKYPEKIILIKNEKNEGLNCTLNRCLALADTEYVAIYHFPKGLKKRSPFWTVIRNTISSAVP